MTNFHGYPIRVVGISWFREEDYPILLTIFEDAHKMPRAWKEWLKGAEKMEQKLKTDGHSVERGNSQAVGYAIRVGMTWLGGAARVWRILHPCFLAVETTDLRRAKI